MLHWGLPRSLSSQTKMLGNSWPWRYQHTWIKSRVVTVIFIVQHAKFCFWIAKIPSIQWFLPSRLSLKRQSASYKLLWEVFPEARLCCRWKSKAKEVVGQQPYKPLCRSATQQPCWLLIPALCIVCSYSLTSKMYPHHHLHLQLTSFLPSVVYSL